MTKAARVSRILTMLRTRKGSVSTKMFLETLEVDRSTFFRDIDVLRDQMGHPIVYDKKLAGWRLEENPDPKIVRYELPGVWVSSEECYALLTLHRVLRSIDPGFLETYVAPLSDLLKRMLDQQRFSTHGFSHKVAIRLGNIEKVKPRFFLKVSEALVNDKRLDLSFVSKTGKLSRCEVSPQRVVLTSEGWHLEVLDHEDGKIHTLAIGAITGAEVLPQQAELSPLFEQAKTDKPGAKP